MSNQESSKVQVEIRELQGITELEDVEKLQLKVWGSDDVYESKSLLLAIQHEGGLLAGAFIPVTGMVGFVFAFPTRDPHIQHSHRLAVLEEWRKLGLGVRLKWFQRAWSLERGIEIVRWTYDPLRVVNADLNIRRLGATAVAYLEDYYGSMGGINAGVPSDRLLVEWRLNDDRVVRNSLEAPVDKGYPDAVPANAGPDEKPGKPIFDLESPQVSVRLPKDFGALLTDNLALAHEWRLHVRGLLTHYLQRGYRITEFTRVGSPAYILEK